MAFPLSNIYNCTLENIAQFQIADFSWFGWVMISLFNCLRSTVVLLGADNLREYPWFFPKQIFHDLVSLCKML